MRAATLLATGDLDRIQVQDIPAPTVEGPDDVCIDLKAAGLNHLDLFVVRGLPGVEYRFPHILGADGAGVVADVGAAVTGFKPGDRVIFNPGISCYSCDFCLAGEHSLCRSYRLLGEHGPGTLAQRVVVPQQNLAPLSADRTWAEGAAFSLVTLTAWRMVVTRARVRPGEWVLVWGIGGGVALAAMRIAKLMGATVVVTSSSDEKLEGAHEMGADYMINHRTTRVSEEVWRLTAKRGVDVVIENVGEATWAESLRSLGRQGRLVTCGSTSGPHVMTDVRRLYWYQYTILGSTMGNASEYQAITGLLAQGHLVPLIDSTYPLERTRAALEHLAAARQMGKVVVII